MTTITNTNVLLAEPQFSETVVSGSRTKQLYSWLEEKGFLWMLEEPHDQLLAVFAGSAPVVRMWHWSQRASALTGDDLPTAPETEGEVENAFVLVERVIRQHSS